MLKISIFVVVFCLFLPVSVGWAEDFETLISDFSSDTARATAAINKVKAAGKEAFPALLGRMNDQQPTNPTIGYQLDRMPAKLNRSQSTSTPTGSVCFLLIREQLEMESLMMKSDLHYITETNVAQWLNERSELSLRQMRIEVHRATLELICQSVAEHDLSDVSVRQLNRFSDRLLKLMEAEKEISK